MASGYNGIPELLTSKNSHIKLQLKVFFPQLLFKYFKQKHQIGKAPAPSEQRGKILGGIDSNLHRLQKISASTQKLFCSFQVVKHLLSNNTNLPL